jgi:hypothetical protein
MRLRPLALDRQASFGITSSVDDAKPGANTLQSCSYALNVDQIGTHKLKPHDGITSRRAVRECDSATGVHSNAQHGTSVVYPLNLLKSSH